MCNSKLRYCDYQSRAEQSGIRPPRIWLCAPTGARWHTHACNAEPSKVQTVGRDLHTHTYTSARARARAHTRTHTHIQIAQCISLHCFEARDIDCRCIKSCSRSRNMMSSASSYHHHIIIIASSCSWHHASTNYYYSAPLGTAVSSPPPPPSSPTVSSEPKASLRAWAARSHSSSSINACAAVKLASSANRPASAACHTAHLRGSTQIHLYS